MIKPQFQLPSFLFPAPQPAPVLHLHGPARRRPRLHLQGVPLGRRVRGGVVPGRRGGRGQHGGAGHLPVLRAGEIVRKFLTTERATLKGSSTVLEHERTSKN